jgi:hypothetical protein
MKDFNPLIERAVRPIHASAARKQAMCEELLAHLQAAYEQELPNHLDPQTAVEIAQQRLGDIDELGAQLQASVPMLERILLRLFRKEILMSTWLWILAWTVVLTAMMIIAPREMLPVLSAVAVIGAAGIVRLTHEDNTFTRWLGPRWGWRAFAILFGPSIILPALAKLKHAHQINMLAADVMSALIVALSLGALVMLIGIVSTIHSVAKRHAATA